MVLQASLCHTFPLGNISSTVTTTSPGGLYDFRLGIHHSTQAYLRDSPSARAAFLLSFFFFFPLSYLHFLVPISSYFYNFLLFLLTLVDLLTDTRCMDGVQL